MTPLETVAAMFVTMGLAIAGGSSPIQTAAEQSAAGTGPAGAPPEWVDIASRAGVVTVILYGLYLIVFSGRLRPEREFHAMETAHAREVAALHVSHDAALAARDDQLSDLRDRLASVISDRDAWKLASGNALEAANAATRASAATLDERSVVVSAFDALKAVALEQGNPRGTGNGGG